MNNLIELNPIDLSDAKACEAEVAQYEKLSGIIVNSQMSMNQAVDIIRMVDTFEGEIEKKRTSITKPLDIAKKAVMDLFRPSKEKCNSISAALRQKVSDYQRQQREAEEKERARLEKEAQAKAKEEQQKLLDKAAEHEANGNLKQAEKTLAKAQEVAPKQVLVAPKVENPTGASFKKVWRYRIVNEQLIPHEYLTVNEKAIQSIATAFEGKKEVPGVEFFAENITIIRK